MTIAVIYLEFLEISNGTEWSPIGSVIIRVITKSDDRTAGVLFVYHNFQEKRKLFSTAKLSNTTKKKIMSNENCLLFDRR